MPKKQRNHKLRRVRSAIHDQHWAIHQPALTEMFGILEDSVAGSELGADAMSQRFGMAGASDSRMEIVSGVAMIPITGILQPKPNSVTRYYGGTATSQIEDDFKRAMADSQVRAVVFLVDSPGGSAMGNEEVAKTIFAARGAKPITAYVRGMCASAAYYIASSADKIIASPSSSVGSIGTIYVHQDVSKLYKDFGVTVTNIAHGKHKADGSPYVALDDQSKQTLQEYVDAYGKQFVSAVARHRGITASDVMERFGQGKVFLADEAKSIGMVDSVDTLGSAVPRPSAMAALADGWESANESANVAGHTGMAIGLMSGSHHVAQQVQGTTQIPESSQKPTEPTRAAEAASTSIRSLIMDKIKAALFSRGLIDKIDASDEVCKAVLAGYFRGTVPESEEKILEAINSSTQEPAGEQASQAASTGTAAAANVQAAHDKEIAEAKAAAVTLDRERRESVESAGNLLGMSSEDIQTALKSEDSDRDIIAMWHKKLAEQQSPVSSSSVNVTGEGADRFATDAIDALLVRSGYDAASKEQSPESVRLQDAPLSHIARQCLSLNGGRVDTFADPEQVALDALQMSGHNVVTVSAAGPSFNRPGDFPNILSNLAGKVLDQAIQIAGATYPAWTGKMSDLPDFKPRTIIGIGHLDELDEIMDDENPKSVQMTEEAAGWIQAGRYGNKAGLTPVMVANDDLDAFTQALMSLAVAHETTLNRLCLALITGNVTLLDGNSLFDDTNHGNDVESGSGGVPSTTQANLMKLRHRRQTGIGDVGKVRTPPKVALVPSALEEAALQTFATFASLNESKLPITDATINTHRGTLDIVVEPDLEDSSTAIWYTFADPRIRRTVVHAFQRGYGRGGRRNRWFDPGRKTLYLDIEGRFAAAVAGHRGAVRNIGA